MELRCHGVGVICTQPEYKKLGNDSHVCNFRLVFNRNFKSGDQWREEPTYIRATIWGNKAERVGKLSIGTPVFVDGYISMDSWKDQQDNKRVTYILNVRQLEICQKNNETKNAATGGKKKTGKNSLPQEEIPADVDDDEKIDIDDDEETPF